MAYACTVQHFTADDIYSKGILPLDGTFKKTNITEMLIIKITMNLIVTNMWYSTCQKKRDTLKKMADFWQLAKGRPLDLCNWFSHTALVYDM